MSRWTKYIDPDHGRLPEGMQRTAYDADSQCYYYRDTADNSVWRGEPGSQFGMLKLVSRPRSKTTSDAAAPAAVTSKPDASTKEAFGYLDGDDEKDRKDQMFAKDLEGDDEYALPPPPYTRSSRQFTDFNQLLSKKKHRKSQSISHRMIAESSSATARGGDDDEQSVLSKMKRSLSVKQAAAFVRQRSGTL